jgi:single-strand DNA-binding protein
MNKVFLIGRLSRDPELRHTTSGTAVCQINVAISRPVSQGSEPQTDFINVVVWNKQAENVARYLAKGRQIAIEGRIQTRNYDNNEGKRTYVTEVIASNVEFLGSANDNNKPSTNNNPFDENPFDSMEPPMDTTSIDNDPFASFGEKVEISDNELPF